MLVQRKLLLAERLKDHEKCVEEVNAFQESFQKDETECKSTLTAIKDEIEAIELALRLSPVSGSRGASPLGLMLIFMP